MLETLVFKANTLLGFDLTEVLIRVVFLILLSSLLSAIYIWLGNSLSNRYRLALSFPVMALTTMLIISIIKVSLTLSLGLVGALSIVRFRSAIKDPEELVYIFLSITLGLGFGANQPFLTSLFFLIILLVIIGQAKLSGKLKFKALEKQAVHLEIELTKKQPIKKIVKLLDEHCLEIKLRKVSQADKHLMMFLIKPKTTQSLDSIQSSLKKLDKKVNLTIFEYQSLV